MRRALLHARILNAVRRWKAGGDPQDVNRLVAELDAELDDVAELPPPPDRAGKVVPLRRS